MTQPPDIQELEQEIARLEKEKEESVANQDFERAADLRDKAYQLRKKMEQIQKDWREREASKEAGGTVDKDVIAETVAKMTGIPLSRLEKGEAERLLQMEEELKKEVINQDRAVHSIAKAVRRSRSGLKDPRRPMGSFLFLGPSGVGKTHLSKALARFMFGDEDAIIQIDMSEYMEKHNASRLIGAPPGYVGYEEGGHLTEKVRRRPYSVVLLDEIEKAHPDIFNMLLQVMEEGRLTDSFGRNIDFKNTILIMTSNIGANLIRNSSGLGFQQRDKDQSFEKMKEMVLAEVERHFRPEFLNRLDEIIVFNQLQREDLDRIIHIELAKVTERLKDRDLSIELTPEALEFLVEKGYSPEQGARPLRRAIEHHLEDPLAEEVLKESFEGKTHLLVELEDGKLKFTPKEAPAEGGGSTEAAEAAEAGSEESTG